MPNRKPAPHPAQLALFEELALLDDATHVDPRFAADLEARLRYELHPASQGGRPTLTLIPGGLA